MTLYVKRTLSAWQGAVIWGMIWSHPASADFSATKPALGISGGLEYFHLEELNATGSRLLSESGNRYVITGHLDSRDRFDPAVRWHYQIEAAAYAGSIDYNGQSQNVDPTQGNIPFNTQTEYQGGRAEGLVSYRFQASALPGIEVLAGLGVDGWLRRIQSGIASDGSQVNGVEEVYRTYYGKIALGLSHAFTPTWRGRLQGGLKMPFSISEDIGLLALGFNRDITVSPGNAPSGFIKLVMEPHTAENKPGNLLLAFYYDGLRFDRSETELVTFGGSPIQAWQPETHIDVFGAQIGYRF